MAANEVLARVADVASSDLLAFIDVDEQGGVKVAEGATHFLAPRNVGDPWYVVSLGELLILSAPSGLLCGNWGFPSPFPRRCSHGYQVQVKSSSIAALFCAPNPPDTR